MKNQNLETSILEDSKMFATPERFSYATKLTAKKNLQSMLKISKSSKKMIIAFSLEKNDSKTRYLFEEIMDGLAELPIYVVVLGEKKPHYHDYENIKFLNRMKQNFPIVLKGADLVVLPESLELEINALKNSTPFIYLRSNMYTGYGNEYNPLEENGNAFPLDKENSWLLFYSITKALDTYTFPYDWQSICRNAFETGQGL